MVRGVNSASDTGDHGGGAIGSAQGRAAPSSYAVGKISRIVGSVIIARADGAAVQAQRGDSVFQGDRIETGAHGAVSIAFKDGTEFKLSAGTSLMVDEFICDANGVLDSGLFSLAQGAFAFSGGKIARAGRLCIDTPVATIRGSARSGGMGVLTLAAFTLALIQEIHAALLQVGPASSRVSSDVPESLDADILRCMDFNRGVLTIDTKGPAPESLTVDDPCLSLLVTLLGFSFIPNTSQQMATLLGFSQNAFATFSLGQQDPFIQQQQRADLQGDITGSIGSSASGSGGPFSNVPLDTSDNSNNSGPPQQNNNNSNSDNSFPDPVIIDDPPPAPPPPPPPTVPILALNEDTGTPGDFITSNGQVDVSGLEAGSLREYSLDGGATWTAFAGDSFVVNGTDGLKSVIVRQSDGAGNVSPSSDPLVFTLDTANPTVTAVAFDDANDLITDADAGGQVTLTITFSEAMDQTVDPVVTTNAGTTLTNPVGVWTSATTFEVTYDVVDADVSLADIQVGVSGAQDANGNTQVAADNVSSGTAIDTVNPTVAIDLDDTELTVGETATITFEFSEVPVGFDASDVDAPNGTLGPITPTGDPLVFTATYTPDPGVNDNTNVITVGTGWTDAAGNPPAAAAVSANYTINTLAFFTFQFDGALTIIADDPNDFVDNMDDPNFNGGAGGDGGAGANIAIGGPTTNNVQNENVTAAGGSAGGDGEDGLNAVEITNTAPYTGIKIVSAGDTANEIIGGNGGDGGDGGNGGSISVSANNNINNNIFTAGDGGNGGAGGSGGHAIVNGDLSTIIIEGSQDLTILGGDRGEGGDGGDGGNVSVVDGNNVQNSTLTAGDGGDGVDGGTGGDGGNVTIAAGINTSNTTSTNGSDGQSGASSPIVAAFSDRVDVDASAFTGELTISGSDDDDTMIFGSGGTKAYATLGSDAYTFGSGEDSIWYTSAAQSNGTTSTDSLNNFDLNNDSIDISLIAQAGWNFDWDDDTDVLRIDLDGDATFDMLISLVGVDANQAQIGNILVA